MIEKLTCLIGLHSLCELIILILYLCHLIVNIMDLSYTIMSFSYFIGAKLVILTKYEFNVDAVVNYHSISLSS